MFERLRWLLMIATPRPWEAREDERGPIRIYAVPPGMEYFIALLGRTEHVAGVDHRQGNAELAVGAVNALPALLELYAAAGAWRESWRALDDAAAAVARRQRARERLFAALDALDAMDRAGVVDAS